MGNSASSSSILAITTAAGTTAPSRIAPFLNSITTSSLPTSTTGSNSVTIAPFLNITTTPSLTSLNPTAPITVSSSATTLSSGNTTASANGTSFANSTTSATSSTATAILPLTINSTASASFPTSLPSQIVANPSFEQQSSKGSYADPWSLEAAIVVETNDTDPHTYAHSGTHFALLQTSIERRRRSSNPSASISQNIRFPSLASSFTLRYYYRIQGYTSTDQEPPNIAGQLTVRIGDQVVDSVSLGTDTGNYNCRSVTYTPSSEPAQLSFGVTLLDLGLNEALNVALDDITLTTADSSTTEITCPSTADSPIPTGSIKTKGSSLLKNPKLYSSTTLTISCTRCLKSTPTTSSDLITISTTTVDCSPIASSVPTNGSTSFGVSNPIISGSTPILPSAPIPDSTPIAQIIPSSTGLTSISGSISTPSSLLRGSAPSNTSSTPLVRPLQGSAPNTELRMWIVLGQGLLVLNALLY